MPRDLSGADALLRDVFGVPGDAINDFTDALRRRDDMRFILVRHEEAGAFMASAQAKLTGRLAACMGTSGPGAVHLLNGLYDAKLDHAPVIAITGWGEHPGALATEAQADVVLELVASGHGEHLLDHAREVLVEGLVAVPAGHLDDRVAQTRQTG